MTNKTEVKEFPVPKVQEVINEYKIVINRGSIHGLKEGQKFLLYALSDEEIKDLDTNESLGFLEIVKGIGQVTHVQEKLATLEPAETIFNEKKTIKTISRKQYPWQSTAMGSVFGEPATEEVETIVEPPKKKPFENPRVGDRARPI